MKRKNDSFFNVFNFIFKLTPTSMRDAFPSSYAQLLFKSEEFK